MAIPPPPGPYTNLRDISEAMASVGAGTTSVAPSATAESPDGGLWVYDPVGGWQYNAVRNPSRSGLMGVVEGLGENVLDPVLGNPYTWLAAATGAGLSAAGAFGGAAAAPAVSDAALLGSAGVTPTYAPAGLMTVGGTEAAAAGATPWLSNAPAGSVFSAGTAAPSAATLGLVGTGATLAAGAPTGSGGGGGGGNNAPAAAGTALSRILGGTATGADWLSVLGIAGATGLGYYGAGQQADALRDIAAQGRADRAPFLSAATNYLTNPDAYFQGPGKTALDANLRALSARFGNPIDSPTALGIASQAAMADWRNAVSGLGNLGLAGEDTRANLLSGAAGAEANQLNALGYGLSQVTNPPSSLEQLLRQIGSMRGLT